MNKTERKSLVSNSNKSGLPFNRRNNTKLQISENKSCLTHSKTEEKL
jgi:hypothetical protein